MNLSKNLWQGNKRYAEGDLSSVDIQNRIAALSMGQSPKAVILSCLDSRVPVEKIFDLSIGDIFVGRVAGNVENEAPVGSMEFATKVAGSRLVMVLGHEGCGAVKGACQNVQLANLTELLEKSNQRFLPLKDMESAGNIKIVGAVYSLETGKVTLLN